LSNVLVRRLQASEADAAFAGLCALLIDCVDGGASVSFMHPMTRAKAERFWRGVLDGAARNDRALLIAEEDGGEIVGSVQLVYAVSENQPHRADVAKLLVHRRARGRGVAQRLMQQLENVALQEKRTLLVLDTITGGTADRLYTRMGWQRVGEIPDYALMPDRAPTPTTVFYKQL
jgi:GNAT superfamily N-acetyltransferase